MKRIKNTGFRITIALKGDGGMAGNISTSTAHYIVENLLKRHEAYNTSIKEMPGIIHSSDCNFHTATILLADFHSPDESSTSRLAEQLEELTGSDVFVQKYQVAG